MGTVYFYIIDPSATWAYFLNFCVGFSVILIKEYFFRLKRNEFLPSQPTFNEVKLGHNESAVLLVQSVYVLQIPVMVSMVCNLQGSP